MDSIVLLLAAVLTFLGCSCFYVASPNQTLLREAPAPRSSIGAGVAVSAAGLIGFAFVLFPTTGIAVFCTALMVGLVALPHVGAMAASLRRET